jgi:putative FmdB family regulatory protein
VVLEASQKLVKAYRKGGETVEISGERLKIVQKNIGEKIKPNQRIRRGTLIRVQKDERDRWQITQLPAVEAAVVSLNPNDGAIRALDERTLMPTYEYECRKCGKRHEASQSIMAKPLTKCPKPKCGGRLKRLLGSGGGLLFKGSGFYATDHRSSGYKKQASEESKSCSGEPKSCSGPCSEKPGKPKKSS